MSDRSEQQPQRQDSLCEQLRDLIPIANRHGMYDAASYLTEVLGRAEERAGVTG
jgi:hypothetical protein